MPDRYCPSPDALESRVGDEIVLLHLGNSTYYGLDAVGAQIWALLKEGQDTDAIRDRLAAGYGVDRATIAADMARFLADLVAHDIIRAA